MIIIKNANIILTSLFFPLSLVVNKAKMLSAGVTEAVLKFLKSEMPPVQFKLLGTLRMLIDAQGKRNAFSRCIFWYNSLNVPLVEKGPVFSFQNYVIIKISSK